MSILQKLSYGQYIVTSVKNAENMTTRNKDFLAAGTVNWATQCSMHPPMLAIATNLENNLQETIEKSRYFTLHILGENQKDLISSFAKDSDIDEKTINGIPYSIDENHQLILMGGHHRHK